MLHRNLPLKAAAFALAVFLWFWVLLNEGNPIVEVPVKVAITAQSIGKGLALRSELPTADVRVRGLKREAGYAQAGVEAYVSCRGLEEGSYRLAVQVRAPEEVTVAGVRPPEVSVALEKVVSEAKTVELRLLGQPPSGYEVVGAGVSPRVIRVSGPRSRVDRAARLLVTMDLGRAVPEAPVSLPVRAVNSSGDKVEGVSLTPARANVLVSMKLVVSPRTVPVVLRTRGRLPADVRIVSVQVQPPMVTIMGPAARVQQVAEIETEPLPLDGVHERLAERLRLVVPEEVNLLSDPSVRVTVTVEKRPTAAPGREDNREG